MNPFSRPRVIATMEADDLMRHHTPRPTVDEWEAMRLLYEVLLRFTEPERRRILEAAIRRIDDETAAQAAQET